MRFASNVLLVYTLVNLHCLFFVSKDNVFYLPVRYFGVRELVPALVLTAKTGIGYRFGCRAKAGTSSRTPNLTRNRKRI